MLSIGSYKRGAYYLNRPHAVCHRDLTMLNGIVPPLLVTAGAIVMSWARHRYLRNIRGAGPRWSVDLAVALGIVGVTALLELAMGRAPVYARGPIALWVGSVNSAENSQQLSDPYTFSHVIHGALFYGITYLVMPRASFGARLIVALTMEGAWEAYENTDTVINRYRAATIALGYYGDSVLNSVSDKLACLLGFWLASRARWWWTVSWMVAIETL